MNWRKHGTSLALALAAIVLGVWIWVDRGSITEGERAARPNNVFPAYRRDELSRVEIDKANEKLVLARDVDGSAEGGTSRSPNDRDADAAWRIESPFAGAADPAAVDQLLGALEFATYVRKVDPKASPTFDAPRASGSITMGKLTFHFALGGAAPSPEGASYFKVDGNGVFVISKELAGQLLRGADAYKSRTIVPYLSLDLASIDVKSKAGDVLVERSGELTFKLHGSNLRASREALDKLWSALAEMRAESFLDADVKDPVVTITMTPKDGRPRGVILVGGACPSHADDLVVVRTEPTRLAACAPRGILDGLTQSALDLADTRLFFAHEDEVEEIALTNAAGDQKIELARKGSGWHARAPFDRDLAGDEVDAANALDSAVVRAKGTNVAPIASEPFTLRAHVRVRGGEMQGDELVDLGEGAKGAWVVHRLADGARLDVTPEIARRLQPSKSALKGRDVVQPPLDPKDVTSLTLRCGTPQDLTRDGGTWKLSSPRGYVADQAGALDLVDQIAHLRADSWIADTDDGSFGFASSACNVTLGARGGRTLKLALGRDGETGLYAIATDSAGGTSPVFLEPRIFRDSLSRILIDRSALAVETADATSIVLARGGARIELRRVADKLVGPDAGLPKSVESIAAALDALRADDVVRLGPPAPDEGFDAPSLDVRAETETDAGKRTVHVRFGRDVLRKNQAMVFARIDGVDATFAVVRERVDPIRNAL
ncbi:MAG TPA: DUF4340 domain-containing protein [Polyangiaceae bacterium]|jgi:hypothetical protein